MKRSDVIELLCVTLKESLGLGGKTVVEHEKEFSHYGMNSINAAKFSYTLSQALDLELTPKVIIENFSVAELARYLMEDVTIANRSVKDIALGDHQTPVAATNESMHYGSKEGVNAESNNEDKDKQRLIQEIVQILRSRATKNNSLDKAGSLAVTLQAEPAMSRPSQTERLSEPDAVDLSFIFFSSQHKEAKNNQYDYVKAIARYADANGFKAIWIPERHFFEFGGIFPDPALLLSNLASTTSTIRLRSGSVVLPLHHPARVVESWAMLDNLSQGRVDIGFASGWNPNDFVLSRETYGTLRETWYERMSQVERLWRGEAVAFYNGKQELVPIKVFPRPVQERLAIWMAISGNPESFVEAGRRGYNVLTMLTSKPTEELEANIARYREARAEQGLDPKTGIVSLMLHTYVHADKASVDACVNEHYFGYIKSGLMGHVQAMSPQPSETEIKRIVEHSFHYQRKHSALFGDVDHCRKIVEKMRRIGVNEIACLVDFGISETQMYETLPYITQLKNAIGKLGVQSSSPTPHVSQEFRLTTLPESGRPQEYAIVGLAGRYPGAKTLEGFWDNLLENRNCVSEISSDRYDWCAFWGDPKTQKGKTNIRHFGLLEDIYRFDANFFRISKREAELMDPHARLLLETAWQCIENAGYAPQSLNQSRTGVFLSFYNSEYSQLMDSLEIEKSSEPYLGTALSGTIKANRISFLLGLKGPSETYDTACSSSLVALHRATQSIAAGDCDQALVAGVSLLLTPQRVISLSKMGILNESGVCNPYSYPAKKEVIGEGVGALLVKPLEQALAAKDYIYAVMSGSDVNHQGDSSGSLTMPSSASLAELMEKTYRKLNVARESICYVEGHGSGNDSDLVELMAFRQCFSTVPSSSTVWVGSVKSNIGFGEGAGGMAQLSKCALALNHGVVPATINFERADPSIDLASSRLAIQTVNRELDRNALQNKYISVLAYGLGGTNAHIVLRNHRTTLLEGREAAIPRTRFPLLFSARSETALAAYLQEMHIHLRRDSVRLNYAQLCGSAENVLEALFRTLLGRERNASHRSVLIVSSYDDVLAQLANAIAHRSRTRIVPSSVARTESVPIQSSHELETTERLATIWATGVEVDWSVLHECRPYQRLALPPVPFDGDELRLKPKAQSANMQSVLHPLLHKNTSNAFDTQFTSEFSGDESFLTDHRINGTRILPGVAHLEMARVAIEKALVLEPMQVAIELTNVVWLRPAVLIGSSLTMHISVRLTSEREVEYDIYRVAPETGEKLLFSQGRGRCLEDAPPSIDLAELRSRCANEIRRRDEIYQAFNAQGQQYGVGYQGIVKLCRGVDDFRSPHVLAELQLPNSAHGRDGLFGLHPGLLDSALQASSALDVDMSTSPGSMLNLPFALESIIIYRPLPTKAYGWVRFSSGSGQNEAIGKIDISVCDQDGVVCADLKCFSSRPLRGELGETSQVEAVLLGIDWEAEPCDEGATGASLDGHRVLLLSSPKYGTHAAVGALLPEAIVCDFVELSSGSLHDQYLAVAEKLTLVVRQLLAVKSNAASLLQLVIQVGVEPENSCFAGLSALLKTAHRENPRLITQCIEIVDAITSADLARLIQLDARNLRSQDLRYVKEMRCIRRLRRLATQSEVQRAPLQWRKESVILITGGAGGLGLILARAIAQHAQNATLILVGRARLSPEKQRQIDELRILGLTVDYQQADVADRASVQTLFAHIANSHRPLTAIVHCAGVVNSSSPITEKTAADFRQIMAAKVSGVVNLDEASQAFALDYFIGFSSVASVFGLPGHGEYAAANGFMDAYIHYRTGLVMQGRRIGKSLSINWPTWADGGMRHDEISGDWAGKGGVRTLGTELGLAVLNVSLELNRSRVVVISGNQSRSHSCQVMSLPKANPAGTADAINQMLLQKVKEVLLEQVAAFLKTTSDQIDLKTELGEYGLDSIGLTELCNQLNQSYELDLIPTVFFEYPTLDEFAIFLTREYGGRLSIALKVRSSVATEGDAMLVARRFIDEKDRLGRGKRASAQTATDTMSHLTFNDPIAIIGMSGCFPGAGDVDELWENLRSGKDCIGEIPCDRWDWRAMYGDPNLESNKTDIKWGGFIEGVDEFDPLFFGISPREAEYMDPTQRLLMTFAWKAIEDAGYASQSLWGTRTGVFIGTDHSGYGDLIAQAGVPTEDYSATGLVSSLGPNRLSYLLNLHGPSEPIETACSSSLIAIHRARKAMLSGECDMALVGGINIMVTPWAHICFSKAGMLCADGRSKAFSKDANGYVRGEGVGMLFLKRLSLAKKDADHVYGLVRGSSQNHGGRANSLTAPNPKAQAELIKDAYREAKIDPRSVTYIEAHGTGTPLGDPIEINALKNAFEDLHRDLQLGEGEVRNAYCGIGSVKSNIGHLELASGVAGVIKVLLQFRHGVLAASLHCNEINPYIQLDGSPFFIVTKTQTWPAVSDRHGRPLPRRAGVSSFGFGGVNAHVILEEYPDLVRSSHSEALMAERPALIVLSAKNEERLNERAGLLLAHTDKCGEGDLSNIAYTLQIGRDAMEHRLAFAAETLVELRHKLAMCIEGALTKGNVEGIYRGEVRKGRDVLSAFNIDDDTGDLIDTWLKKGKYSKVLALWVQGLAIDWGRLYEETAYYGGAKSRRMSLPSYPFARERYWVPKDSLDSVEGGRTVDSSEAAVTQRDSLVIDPSEQTSWTGETVLFKRQWHAESIIGKSVSLTDLNRGEHIILLDIAYSDLASELHRRCRNSRVEILGNIANNRFPPALSAAEFISLSQEVFVRIQGLLKTPKQSMFVQLVIVRDAMYDGCLTALSGLFKTAQHENPNLSGQVIEVGMDLTVENLVQIVNENTSVAGRLDQQIRYVGAAREVIRFEEICAASSVDRVSPWKDRGIYLITGGSGGLGTIVAQSIIDSVHAPVVVLVGRSNFGPENEAQIKLLEKNEARIEYRVLDVTDADAVIELIDDLVRCHGTLDGVVHSAGVISDNFIINKTAKEFREVLGPKVLGTMNLDLATQSLPLDFFIMFSSVSGLLGNVGQCDYATANAFMDWFALYRGELVRRKQRAGQSLAVAWPFWLDGGMRLSEASLAEMQGLGLNPLTTRSGIAALYDAYASGESRVTVLSGRRHALTSLLERISANSMNHGLEGQEVATITQEHLTETTLHQLKAILGTVAKLRVDAINADDTFESYGIDSLMIARLNQKLGAAFAKLSKTIYYEYPTLNQLAEYMARDHRDESIKWSHQVLNKGSTVARSEGSTKRDNRSEVASGCSAAIGSPLHPAQRGGVAIIGMSGRFPQANTLIEFWENLKSGRDCISEIPTDRWSLDGFYEADVEKALRSGKSYCKWGGFIDDVTEFDPMFFNISPGDAKAIDPHERLFLQECWKAFEDAGYVPSQFSEERKNRVGVYGAITKSGVNASFAALVNRVSYALDLRGPSVAVDTMCSSSLVALHRACEDLRQRNIDLALVGAVNLYLTPKSYCDISAIQLLSKTRAPLVFSEGGTGFVPSEGVGVVVLSRLSDAERNGDNVLATILGSAVNHSGKTNGYMVPNPNQQANVIECAIANAGIDASRLDYIELAANGSELGDALEMRALAKVFPFGYRKTGASLRVGSLKAMLGHGEAVAGMAQLMKVVLQLRHGMICPAVSPGFTNANMRSIEPPFAVPTRLMDWSLESVNGISFPRCAGITNVGAGGVNAHLVVEEYPSSHTLSASPNVPPRAVVFVLSARSKNTLAVYLSIWKSYLEANPDIDIVRLCYTLQTGREAMKYRFSCVIGGLSELVRAIESAQSGRPPLNCQLTGVDHDEGGGSYDVDMVRSLEVDASLQKPLETARTWVQGNDVAWKEFYVGGTLSILSGLPTYPFRKTSYPTVARSEVRTKDNVEDRVEVQLPDDVSDGSLGDTSGRCRYDSIVELGRTRQTVPSVGSNTGRSFDVQGVRTKIILLIKQILDYGEGEDFDEESNFVQMGFSSITIVRFAAELKEMFGLPIPETIAFDYPEIASLAKHLTYDYDVPDALDSNRGQSDASHFYRQDWDTTIETQVSIDEILSKIAEGHLTVDEAERLIH
jgi:natural product biosynthesis luciferase-like monooxygenase protein